jgi:hypothetical protein
MERPVVVRSTVVVPKHLIRNAIQDGAPMYNAGHIADCADLYQSVLVHLCGLYQGQALQFVEGTLQKRRKRQRQMISERGCYERHSMHYWPQMIVNRMTTPLVVVAAQSEDEVVQAVLMPLFILLHYSAS